MAGETLAEMLQRLSDSRQNLFQQFASQYNDEGEEMQGLERQMRILTGQASVSNRLATLRVARRALKVVNDNVMMPFTQGLQLPFNPMNFAYTATNAVAIAERYQKQEMQSRAFLNSTGAQVVNPESLERFKEAFAAIGASKGDVLGAMQQLALVSQQVSVNMDRATASSLNFAKANGIEAGKAIVTAGLFAKATGTELTADTTNRTLENLRNLAGSNVRFDATSQAVLSLQAGTLQSGQIVGTDARGVDNAMNLVAGFQRLNPALYGPNPELAVKGVGEMRQAGKGMLLGFAMDAAAAAGMPTDITSVMAALDSNDPKIMGALMKMAGRDQGMSELLALSGISPGMLLDLRKNPNAFDAGFNPTAPRSLDDQLRKAAGFTTPTEQLKATYESSIQNTTGAITGAVNLFSDAVKTFANATTMLSIAAGVNIGTSLMTNPMVRGLAGRALNWGKGLITGARVAGTGTAAAELGGAAEVAAGATTAGLATAAVAGTAVALPLAGMALARAKDAEEKGYPVMSRLPGENAMDARMGGAMFDFSKARNRREDASTTPATPTDSTSATTPRSGSASVSATTPQFELLSRRAEIAKAYSRAEKANRINSWDSEDVEPDELQRVRKTLEKKYGVRFLDRSFLRTSAATRDARLRFPGGTPLDAPNSHRLEPDGTSRSADYMQMVDDATERPIMYTDPRFKAFARDFEEMTPNYKRVPESHIPGTIHMQLERFGEAVQRATGTVRAHTEQQDLSSLNNRHAAASFFLPSSKIF